MTKQNYGASYFNGCPIAFPDFIEMCHGLGMSFIEIQMEPPFSPPEIDTRLKETVIDCLGTYNLTPTIHGPYDDINLSSFKERIRRSSLDIMKDCIDFADDIGSTIIVVHGGSCSIHQISRYEDAVQRFRASLLELAMYAHDRGIQIGVENKQLGRDRELVLYPDEHFEVVQEYSDFDVRAVVDVGHAHTADIAIVEYLEKMNPYLIEVHLHDNDGSSDAHVSLGKGTADIKGAIG
ncbi:MAG: sugar phosphate isomerase/epimerase family protein, partial [Candidatus Thorarchaeota archaeon]